MRDQLPLSGSGTLITTVEPKFIPREAVELSLGEDVSMKLRLIDCVGFLVPEATGNMENEKERMVKTPWFQEAIPFHQAAEIGTRKVIAEHSTLGLMVTADGSFGEIPRQNFEEAEARTVEELKKQGKPFLILVNSVKPYREETQKLTRDLSEKYGVSALAVNCDQLRSEDIVKIMECLLYEFPVRQVEFYIPKWVELLPLEHPLKGPADRKDPGGHRGDTVCPGCPQGKNEAGQRVREAGLPPADGSCQRRGPGAGPDEGEILLRTCEPDDRRPHTGGI